MLSSLLLFWTIIVGNMIQIIQLKLLNPLGGFSVEF